MQNDLRWGELRGPSREWYQPPESRECECTDSDDDPCPKCAVDMYNEDYMKDPDRARDEKIDRELEGIYD